MPSIQTLLKAHTPQKDFITKLNGLYYTGFISVAEMKSTPDNTLRAFSHSHSEYEFLLPRTPVPLSAADGVVQFAEAGYVYPVHSGKEHSITVEACDTAACSITVGKEYMEKRLTGKGLAGSAFTDRFLVSPELTDYINLFENEFAKGAAADKNDLECLGALIVSELIEQGCRPRERRRAKDYRRELGFVYDYINTHYQEQIDMDRLLIISGMSKTGFAPAFKKLYGDTPNGYLSKLRMNKALLLIANTEDTVASIAEQCGYLKGAAFSGMFKTETGKTPTEYREALKG